MTSIVGAHFGWTRAELETVPLADLEQWLAIVEAHPSYQRR